MPRVGSCKGLVNVLVFNFTEPQDAMFALTLALALMFSHLRFPPPPPRISKASTQKNVSINSQQQWILPWDAPSTHGLQTRHGDRLPVVEYTCLL